MHSFISNKASVLKKIKLISGYFVYVHEKVLFTFILATYYCVTRLLSKLSGRYETSYLLFIQNMTN